MRLAACALFRPLKPVQGRRWRSEAGKGDRSTLCLEGPNAMTVVAVEDACLGLRTHDAGGGVSELLVSLTNLQQKSAAGPAVKVGERTTIGHGAAVVALVRLSVETSRT